jgi:Fur family iron response transcriptional regulator
MAPQEDPPGQSSRIPLRRLLELHGITPTRQRLEVAAALLARPQHVSADQLTRMLQEQGSTVSRATVYNTLALFSERGVVRELIVDRDRAFYDSNPSHHHHLYDSSTGTLSDIDLPGVRPAPLPALPEGAVLEGIDVVVRVRSLPPTR